jgi:hypothetical protein
MASSSGTLSIVAFERCLDVAGRWLAACSKGSCNYMVDTLENFPDERLAEMCISSWGLDQPQGDDNDISWLEAHGADRDLLIWAFAAQRALVRAEREKRKP